ncbi:hypothetical protein SteCoe_14828 [Stentor coeruleus]|uniref:Uncharacterized protein n=1 Tax=Stentor coeruleus TaxID=5963 RepID=A0A1R2C551_9CILI|nr:hypothetical protein SteCoe_14828 [Stentor coeruleus]
MTDNRTTQSSPSVPDVLNTNPSFNEEMIENFYDYCRGQLKICKKNAFILTRYKEINGHSFYDSGHSLVESQQAEDKLMEKIAERRKLREQESLENTGKKLNGISSLSQTHTLIFFILRGKDIKNLVPDYEYEVCKQHFTQMLERDSNCHEAHFGLGRLASFEGRYFEALTYVEKAISLRPDPFYIQWSITLSVKTNKPIKFLSSPKSILCCLHQKSASQDMLMTRLETLPESPETLWCNMELCRNGVETEAAEYFATKLKDIDPYLGYLAWSELYMDTDIDKSKDIMKELIGKYPYRPEAYAKLWCYYYYTEKSYEAAEDIASEAFLRVTSPEYNNYYIIMCIACAKSYFKTGKVSSALQLLQKKFLENSEYPIFLYEFARLSCKSEDNTYAAGAVGALKECARLCSSSRLGKIYYWLSKAYMQNRHHLEAYKYIVKAQAEFENLPQTKRDQLKIWSNDMQMYINDVQKAEKYLEGDELTPKVIDECLEICNKVKGYHKVSAGILNAKILWKLGKRKEAIDKLQSICNLTGIRMIGFTLLFKYLKATSEYAVLERSAFEMITKCKNTYVPTEFWVKSNILYAKSLVKNGKPQKAILILKSIAKVFTPLPFINIPFTRALQRATSVEQLMNPSSLHFHLYDTYKSSFTSIREFGTKVIDENDAPVPEIQEFKGRRMQRTATEGLSSFKKFFVFLNNMSDDVDGESTGFMPTNPQENNFVGISIYSKPKFLYLIAKTTLKYNIYVEDGICAIKDYMEILKFRSNSAKTAVRANKAETIFSYLNEIRRN